MDVSVLAAVGSFFVSERVLKPKATVLVILGCVLAYDLTTKTHDVSSLRVYRGPALLAFTLMMSALSLRMWRRNGVACDELMFLPGTPLEGLESTTATTTASPTSSPLPTSSSHRKHDSALPRNNEGDAAAGIGLELQQQQQQRHSGIKLRSRSEEMVALMANSKTKSSSTRSLYPAEEHGSTNNNNNTNVNLSPIAFARVHSESDSDSRVRRLRDALNQSGHAVINLPLSDGSVGQFESWDEDDDGSDDSDRNDATEDSSDNGCRGLCQTNAAATLSHPNEPATGGRASGGGDGNARGSAQNDHGDDAAVQRFRENHPRITRIGTFFFFRSSSSSTQNAAYAPSGPSVFGAALDLSMPILFNFHLFIEAYNHMSSTGSDGTAKILPLIFLTVLIVRSFVPPGKRGRFWSTMKFTAMAPFVRVRFRDAFIGDVLTSLVRPLQDILFALSYYMTVIWGMFSGKYGLSESGVILEHSWLLHNVILPSCAILPLWWKFLQTLRQCYDAKKRWPHAGNSFKYLSAAVVILYGMTHPEDRRSPWWLVAFVLATVYQVCWDTFVDWELLVLLPKAPTGGSSVLMGEAVVLDAEPPQWWVRLSTWRPSASSSSFISRAWLWCQMNILQPCGEVLFLRRGVWWWWMTSAVWQYQVQLRSKRLYKSQTFYWRICFFNAMMRFTWMLCFIPAYHLSPSGEEKVTTFSSDVHSYVGVLLPLAEIVRRTLWGLLLLEKETIRMMDTDILYSRISNQEEEDGSNDDDDEQDDEEVGGSNSGNVPPHASSSSSSSSFLLPTWLNVQQQLQQEAATTSRFHLANNTSATSSRGRFGSGGGIHDSKWMFYALEWMIQHALVLELSLWAVAFVGLGYLACQ